jgi:SecD/SecF fusion protein
LYILTDIGQFIDDLRHDSDNVSLITRNFQSQIIDTIKDGNAQRKVREIFNVEYKDIHSGGQIKHDNLLSMGTTLPIASLKEIMNEDSFKFTDVKLDNLVIDPNKKDNIKNDYIDPLRPYLAGILD